MRWCIPSCTNKLSLVRRVLKKPDLDKDVLKNCRPAANIPLMAEVIEKAAAAQTHFYLETNHLLPQYAISVSETSLHRDFAFPSYE